MLLLLHHLWQQALVIWICLFIGERGLHWQPVSIKIMIIIQMFIQVLALPVSQRDWCSLKLSSSCFFSCFTSAPKRASQGCTLHNSDLSALTGGSCVLLCHKSSKTVEVPVATTRFTTRSVQIALLHTARVACSSSFVWFCQDARVRPEIPLQILLNVHDMLCVALHQIFLSILQRFLMVCCKAVSLLQTFSI